MLKKYNKKSDISYSIGVFPTIELLNNLGKNVLKVVLDPKGKSNQGVDQIKSLCKKLEIRTEISKKSVEFISGTGNAYCVGVYKKFQPNLEKERNHLVLVNPGNMGNLGTICRTMLAFGFKDLAVVRPGVDIFDPKVGRASMGAVFKINFEYFDSFEEYIKKYQNNIYTLMTDGKESLSTVVFKEPMSLVFGNEGLGLVSEFKNYGKSVRIEQSSEVDSLNLAVAVGVSLHSASLSK